MKLTDKAEALWARYEAQVRSRMADRGDVDAGDILTGVREHVEAELGRRGVERATAEDIADVLDRLGGPDQWDDPGVAAAGWADGTGAVPSPRWPGLAALGLTLLGGALILLGFWWSWAPGWGLLVAGVVLARLSLDDPDPERRPGPDGHRPGPTRRLALLIWWVAAGAALLALVSGPAVLTWTAAQIGGPLEAVLPGRPGVPGSPAPLAGYWRLPLLIGTSATAVWWLILGALASRFGDAVRRVLGPARALVPAAASRALTVGAALSILVGLVIGVLS